MMMKMKQSIKRMVLAGAAVTAMMSFAAPAAMAQEVRDHRDGSGQEGPIVRDHRDGSGGILCSIFPASCEPPPYDVGDPVVPPPVVNDPPDPVVDPPPKHCQVLPKGCKPPFGDGGPVLDPVLDPGEDEDPVVTDPPGKEDPVTDPPDKEDPDKDEQPDTDGGSGGNSSGGSGGTGSSSSGFATTDVGGSSGGSVSSASQTIDRGGTFVSGFLPHALTTKMGDAGSAVKKNLPAPMAKSLPNTGGGWSFLVLTAAALIAGGLAIRTIVGRTTSVTRTAQ